MNVKWSAWRWAVLGGLFVAAMDAGAHYISASGYPDEIVSYTSLLDQWISILVYYVVGMLVARETGQLKSGATAGVLAGALAGIVNVLLILSVPTPSELPLPNQLVYVFSLNVFIGGLAATLAAWFASRQAPPPNPRR